MLTETGMVINLPGLNFHDRNDVDWFSVTVPPGSGARLLRWLHSLPVD